jgi:regulatory protein
VSEDRARAALDTAVSLLAARDRTRAGLARRLARHGIDAAASADAIEQLALAGYVDDNRFALRRAETLAERGAGNALILADLCRQGVPEAAAAAAVATLEPEAMRVERMVAARGRTTRTLRLLASKGFAEESLEALIADIEEGAVG